MPLFAFYICCSFSFYNCARPLHDNFSFTKMPAKAGFVHIFVLATFKQLHPKQHYSLAIQRNNFLHTCFCWIMFKSRSIGCSIAWFITKPVNFCATLREYKLYSNRTGLFLYNGLLLYIYLCCDVNLNIFDGKYSEEPAGWVDWK